jgi:hypothetical protein
LGLNWVCSWVCALQAKGALGLFRYFFCLFLSPGAGFAAAKGATFSPVAIRAVISHEAVISHANPAECG